LIALAEEAGDRGALEQAVIFPGPVTVPELAFALAGGKEADGEAVSAAREAVRRLADLSLLTPLDGDAVEAHRWTAESIQRPQQEHDLTAWREGCRRAGESLLW